MTATTPDIAPRPASAHANRPKWLRRRSGIPGFGVTLGVTLGLLSLIVLIPLTAVAIKAAGLSPAQLFAVAFSERALAAYRLTFFASLAAALVNAVFGLLTAWALVRYEFPGKGLINALVDLPFALPTAVAGIALATLYAPNGWIGQFLTPLVLPELASDVEEAAASLGAGRLSILWRIILPALGPAWITGVTLAFARAVGEYGSVIFIAGNMPYKSEIAPLLIVIQLEQYEYASAAAIAPVLLSASFFMLLVINAVQAWARRFQT